MASQKLKHGCVRTQKELEQELGLSHTTVTKMVREGMPRERDGSWNVKKCAEFRDLRQSRAGQGRGIPFALSPTALHWKEEATKADAQLKQLKLAEYAGTLVKKADVMQEWERLIALQKTQFEAFGRDMTPKLIGKPPGEMRAILDKRIYEILRILSESKYVSHF